MITMLTWPAFGKRSRQTVACAMLAALTVQAILSVSHGHAVASGDLDEVAAHHGGRHHDAPCRPHSERHPDECALCAILLWKWSGPAPVIDLAVAFAPVVRFERSVAAERDHSSEVPLGSLSRRGPPSA
jgi:hypothetical protein